MEQNKGSRLLLGQNNNALTWLIIINAVIFVALNFIRIVYLFSNTSNTHDAEVLFYQQVFDWFSLPADLSKLGSRPWTALTFMFTHVKVLELVSTLLWLWGFGFILQDLTGNDKLIPIYIYGGLAGAACFLAVTNLVPGLKANISAQQALFTGGAPIMAIAIATTTVSPRYSIFPMINGGIPLWVLTLIFVAIDYTTVASSNVGYACAHLGAGLIGFVYVRQLKRGNDIGAWMLNAWDWFDDLFSPQKKHSREPVKQQHFYKASKKPFEKKAHFTQQHLDEILDKITQQGYHFLTDEEKEFLKKASEQDL